MLNGRNGLVAAIAQCVAGDMLVVWKLDRFCHSLIDLVGLVEGLKAREVRLKVRTGQGAEVDTRRPEARMIFGSLATLAKFERELIRERTKCQLGGCETARRKGRPLGEAHGIQFEQAREMIEDAKSRADVAEQLGVNVATLRRALNGQGGQRTIPPAHK